MEMSVPHHRASTEKNDEDVDDNDDDHDHEGDDEDDVDDNDDGHDHDDDIYADVDTTMPIYSFLTNLWPACPIQIIVIYRNQTASRCNGSSPSFPTV